MSERQASPAHMSTREKQILELAARGYTDAGMAQHLGISEATVSTYWGRVRTKIGPLNRAELVARFVRMEAIGVLDELRQSNESLRDQLRSAIREGPDNADLYRGIIEHAADAILLVDDRGRIQLANAAVEDVFGYPSSHLEGRWVNDLIPTRYHRAHDEHRATYHDEPARRRMGEHLATFARRSDGVEFLVAATLSLFEESGRRFVVCIVRPVVPS
ncbi:MAG: PAS domain S-box protein [Fimbriimonadaceae bacterium]|nr:PAS domain S-box protein [Chthonomonadaceae bacterium]MCO5295765.1 PAS domain S-box protein [Fimbriimonadaceae bacterium]